ncbi:MAG TPA: aminotransferase class I/II-fold pyridoxal phosphate-dependent enzyme, partial [Polyangia bacterium]
MSFTLAQRIKELPPYLFADIDKKKAALRAQGKDLIDLGIGDPDQPTPAHIVAAMQKAAAEPRFHRYPSYEGMKEFREAAVAWY